MADPRFKVGDILKYTSEYLYEVQLGNMETARVKVIEIDLENRNYRLETLVEDAYNFFPEDEEDIIDEDRWFNIDYIDKRLLAENTLEKYVLDTLKKHGVI